jgi:O-antigen ligase
MLLTFSRGGWLGLIFAGAVFLVLMDRRFIWLGALGLVALYFAMPEAVISRFASIGDLTDGSTSYRVSIWLGTLSMLKDYWLCGIGPGTAAFNMIYPAYSFDSIVAPHAHNLFLQLICDCGVCGIAVFLVLLFLFFRAACGALSRERDRTSRFGLIASISGMCGFLLQSMTDNSFYNYRVLFLFWVFLAIGLLYTRRTSMGEEAAA